MSEGDARRTPAICGDRGFDRPISDNERVWLEVIRLASWDSDPAPTFERVQRLRLIFQGGRPDA